MNLNLVAKKKLIPLLKSIPPGIPPYPTPNQIPPTPSLIFRDIGNIVEVENRKL